MNRLLPLLILLLAAAASHAQTPSTGGPTPQAPDPTTIPLDGGASLMLAGGVAYGLKRLRLRRQR
jgi:hypothetical protein